ncbi:MAG: hypothetical protein ACRDTH_18095 [Pseudonocardiaceae bacterium]
MQVSAEQLEELLDEDIDISDRVESLPGSVLPQPSDESEKHDLVNLDGPATILCPVVVDGRALLVPFDGHINASIWETMSPSNRRSVLGFGVAAAAASVLDTKNAVHVLYQTVTPLVLPAPAPASWATTIYDAVLNPMDAARRAAASLDEGAHNLPTLRVMIDRAMHVSLSSDYGALEQSLPALIGCVEAATMQHHEDERAAHLALSDVYAVAGWTLIKADSPVGAWIAAQRAIQAAEEGGDLLRITAATRCLAEVHMRAGNFEEATRTALLATVQLDNFSREENLTATSLRGAALLTAAAASAR